MRRYVDELMSSERLAKLKVVVRDGGLPGVIDVARRWMRHSDEYLRVRLDLADHRRAANAATSSFALVTGSGTELPALIGDASRLPLEFCGRSPHRRFVLAMADGMPAHITWVLLPGDKSHFMSLQPGQAEITDSHTLSPFRGRGIYGTVLRFTLAEVAALGITSAFAHVRPANRASLATFARAGFTVVGCIAIHRRLGRYTVTDSGTWRSRDGSTVGGSSVGRRS